MRSGWQHRKGELVGCQIEELCFVLFVFNEGANYENLYVLLSVHFHHTL